MHGGEALMICKGHGCIRNDGSNWVKFLSGGCFLFEKNIYFLLNLISARHCWRKKIFLLISSDKNMMNTLHFLSLPLSLVGWSFIMLLKNQSQSFFSKLYFSYYLLVKSHLKTLPYLLYWDHWLHQLCNKKS